MTASTTKTAKKIAETAVAYTAFTLLLIIGIMALIGLFLVSLKFFGAVLDPVVPDGWPSLIIFIIAFIPPIFAGSLVAAALDSIDEENLPES